MRKHDLDDDDEVRDGQSVRVRLDLMDAMQRRFATFDATAHRPHHAELSDELRELRAQIRDEYDRQLTNAWRSPQTVAPCDRFSRSMDSTTLDADQRRSAAYNEMVQRMCDAWRTPARDAAPDDDPSKPDPNAANALQRELEAWKGRDLDDLSRAVEARRRRTHAQFSERVSNAWRAK